ncbi:aldo/keto reductase family oxidoreductase [Aquincola sp. J276]|uniref:aldo/keto reductase n=1 Tax=Aquincola sp. J276 TaxID=2898432 RepID=UPI0021512C66|nr:aldo/keto reductase [Aquincola sp. J276]MCR5866516.1 aldo/keto reductase [Aquincola sp. J276]
MTSTTALTPPNLPLSPIVAGAWRMADWGFGVQQRVAWIEQCIELGITSFDHADIYGSYTVEALFGQALAASPGLRERLQIVGKCGIKLVSAQRPGHAVKSYDSSRAHVVASVDASLQALHTDRLDLLLIHRPDLLMDPDELADTFRSLQAAGKVLQFGVSNHSPAELAMLHRRFPLATHQVELSALQMGALADGTLAQCTDLGLRPMVWSPLGGGRLFTGQDAQAQRVRGVLQALAEQHGVGMATIAHAWILRHPSRPLPIAGSSRIAAMQEAVAALSLRLSAEDWYRVWQASMGHEVP